MNGRKLPAALLLVLALMLSACGSSGSSAASLSQAFYAQSSATCSLCYDITLTVTAGSDQVTLRQIYTADAQLNLSGDITYISGEMETIIDDESTAATEFECYVESCSLSDDAAAYFRYGETYYTATASESFLTSVLFPLTLQLEEGYEADDNAVLYFGSGCDVYTGYEDLSDLTQLFIGSGRRGSTSLSGAAMSIVLYVNHSTQLPAYLSAEFENPDELELSFSDSSGVTYTITALRYELVYSTYGTAMNFSLPDGFRAAALSGDAELNGEGTATESETAESTARYAISAGSTVATVTHPTYTTLSEQAEDSISFCYLYSDSDLETITYTLLENYSSDSEAIYADLLIAYYAESETISGVSAGEVQSLTTSGWEVSYVVITMTLVSEDNTYLVQEILSWAVTPGDTDLLEVDIRESNAADSSMIDPVEALQYAYAFVTLPDTED